MKNFYSFILGLILVSCIGTTEVDRSTGDGYFPRVSGKDLTGEKRLLPNDFHTEKTIVIVAFLQEQQKDVDQWFPHIEKLVNSNEQVEYFELPSIAKLTEPVRRIIYNGMRGGIKNEWIRRRVVTLHLDKEPFKEHLKIKDEKQIYLFLLDKKGKIHHRQEGKYSPQKWQEVLKHLKTDKE